MKPKELGKCRRSDQFQTELNTIRKRGFSIEVSFSRFSRIPIKNEKKPFARKERTRMCVCCVVAAAVGMRKRTSLCARENKRGRERDSA